ncbi:MULTISPECIES: cupredoxin domain-containing protein [Methylocaldum]|jgi:uncharacterized cupredoxin-like copper-binding protein|uniref:cupredoxin domain-containing protein n=2 Tax=Methylocaldum TaxID=73778 RepID=UPI00098B9B2D|nr:cupredoxin family protein [Methylocaldum sp. 14B]MBP1149777.1 putative cupredoxin-like copper-binding protein [Methylocaldum sp. RMAD-M]MVF20472.1 copper-binding protein [Methylocaldum sp. BRCS4]
MSRSIYRAAILATLVMSALVVQAQDLESPVSKDQHLPEEHSGSEQSAAGQPGKPDEVTRTIEIKTLDSMKYDPSSLTINRGETLRLIVNNIGRLTHEATIGTVAEQESHAGEMHAAPDTPHDSPNSVTVEPGQTKELVWRFDRPGRFEIGCHVPGHYQAGMIAEVTVR